MIDVQMELSVVKGVSFMETYKRANLSAIIHEASTSITTTSSMVCTIVHHMKTPSILLCNNNFHVQCSRFEVYMHCHRTLSKLAVGSICTPVCMVNYAVKCGYITLQGYKLCSYNIIPGFLISD